MGKQYDRLTLDERRLIFRLREAKAGIRQIAERLGRHRATIYREVRRNWYDDAEAPRMRGYFPVLRMMKQPGAVGIWVNFIVTKVWRPTLWRG